MEGSLQDEPARRWRIARPPLLAVAALVAVAVLIVAVVAATSPDDDGRDGLAVTQYGDLAWASTSVQRAGDGRARITAALELDGRSFPEARSPQDDFVVYQLAGGRFDTARHTDDAEAERVLDLAGDDLLQILPTEAARERTDATAHPRSGEYTLSLDGGVEYRDIPPGTWELRAYVLDEGGHWDGAVAIRTIRVRS